ncbi:hypothetical protein GCM10010393_14720 [Streptomyces gobitricini]|uniref:Uncharacterized protein n=1 Tax=Streptomyces gobitricini TaxID=68211 RepID=A0ABN3LIE8_9ACTN
MPHIRGIRISVSPDMTAKRPPDHITRKPDNVPSWADDSVAMGHFLFVPGSSPSGGTNGSLRGTGGAVALTCSAPALEEFVAAMAHLEREFLSAWREAGLPILTPGRTDRGHA